MVLPPCHYGFQCYTRELTEEERLDIWYKQTKGLHIMLQWYKPETVMDALDKQNIPR